MLKTELLKSLVCRVLPLVVVACLVAGCASRGGLSGAKLDGMACAQLNAEMSRASKELSSLAALQAKLEQREISRFLVGGERVKSAINDRRGRQMEELRQEEARIYAARQAKGCGTG
jgi:hypothetical protein